MKKIIENKEEIILKNDIRENNNIDYTTPVVNISFNKYWILNFKINENMNKTFISYLYEFVEKIFINESSLNETNEYKTNDDNIMIYNLNNTLNDNESEEEESYKVEINKKRINNVMSKKLFSLRANNDKTLGDENSTNFTKDNENVKNINRGTLIKQFSNNIESTIDLLNEENNENITIKISNLLNNLNFIEYNDNRKLDNIEKN